jgi:hypothetical protein
MRSTHVLLATILTLAFAAPSHPTLAAEPTPQCGGTVGADVQLLQTLRCTGDIGLIITAGATLDLNGHSLTGESGGIAIEIATSEAVTIEDGTLRGWETAIHADGPPTANRFSVAVGDATFIGNGSGISVRSTDLEITASEFIGNAVGVTGRLMSATIDESAFVNNGRAASIQNGGGVAVTDSRFLRNGLALGCSESYLTVIYSSFTDNDQAGESFDCDQVVFRNSHFSGNASVYHSNLSSYGDDVFTGNRFIGNGDVITAGASTDIRNNVFVGNRIAIQALRPQGFTTAIIIERNVLTGNTDAIFVTMPSLLKRNIAVGNSGYGIYAPLATDLGGNIAVANGTTPQCTGVGCKPLGNR